MTKAKAIETLNIGYNGCVKLKETLRNIHDDDNADYLNDLLIALLTAIDALEQNNGWISVKDRLPELFKNVLTVDSDGKIFINWLEEITEMESYFAYGGKAVTHWMPLPPKPESEVDAE